jgi:hypothetical protein
MKNCDILEQLRKALEANCTRVYIPMPCVPANAFTNSDGHIYCSHRAYLHPEAQETNNKSVFICTEVRVKQICENHCYITRPVVVVSLCEGTGSGWSTYDSITIDPSLSIEQRKMFGYEPAASFCWEGRKIVVYFT